MYFLNINYQEKHEFISKVSIKFINSTKI